MCLNDNLLNRAKFLKFSGFHGILKELLKNFPVHLLAFGEIICSFFFAETLFVRNELHVK